jgi:hypothetical protein
MAKKITDYDRGFAQGVALALGTLNRNHDQPTMCAEVLEACVFDRRALKRLGVDDYDLNNLKPVFAEMRQRSPAKRKP